MKQAVLLAVMLSMITGFASASSIWVSSGCPTMPSITPKVYEIYLADQNTIYFSVKDANGDWIYLQPGSSGDGTLTKGTQGNSNRLFKVDALEVGHGFLMQIHAELLSAMANNKQIGFSLNLENGHVTQLTIYNIN